MNISLREITKQDLKDIFEWRNHPMVRKMMFDSSELVWDRHLQFWEKLLNDELVIKYIIELEGMSCGVIRLDLDKSKTIGEIDIFINPNMHGKGVGTLAVKELIKKMKRTELIKMVARVLPENFGSEKMFIRSGFTRKNSFLEFNM